MKNKKVLYLLGIFTLFMQEWGLKPFSEISSDIHLIVSLVYMLLGFWLFRNSKSSIFKLYGKKAYSLIIIGIILSMIPAFIYHNQGVVQSIITYRIQLYWMIVPLLFRMAPSEEEVIKFAYCGTGLVIIMFLMKVINQDLFEIDEYAAIKMKDGEYPYDVRGYSIATIPVFWNLMKVKDSFSWKLIIPIAICYIFIYLQENRSTLFPITLFIAYVFLFSSKTKAKPILVILFATVSIYAAIQTQEVWLSLFEETTSQVDDEDYARNQEIAYYLSPAANPGFLTYLLGNGLVTKNGNTWVELLEEMQIFNSDVGFIGFWNYYGLIPVFVFVFTMIYAICKKGIPYYLKLWAVQMLICSLTISYFGNQIHMIYYALFFYLLYLNKFKLTNYNEANCSYYTSKCYYF